ncbi:MAG TPA: L-threonylcarbamoyladenylate synthase [Candidatus Kapabacteria bacterium]|nr:L-threonylcarbamoyladenylate synthase [Candidatus Kapabacteria bacterium]
MTTGTGTDISLAVKLLRNGGLVSIPTETVYGLAANALNEEAVTKIFEVKDRPFFDPLIVHIALFEQVFKYVESMPSWAEKLFQSFSPGPLTIVLKKKKIIPDIVTAGLETVGIRIPSHPMTLELLHELDFPLAAPSANPFGYVSPTNASHVREQLDGKIEYILDGGDCAVGIESTIVADDRGAPTILRLGGVSMEEIQHVVGKVNINTSGPTPQSPGMLVSHYAPRKKFVIGFPDNSIRAAFLGFKNYSEFIPKNNQQILSSTGDLREAARNVFRAMRDLDGLDVDIIFAEFVPDTGLGRAINDRLKRAAAGHES